MGGDGRGTGFELQDGLGDVIRCAVFVDIATCPDLDAGEHVVFFAKHQDHQSFARRVALKGVAYDLQAANVGQAPVTQQHVWCVLGMV
jgi:hypothetical protein